MDISPPDATTPPPGIEPVAGVKPAGWLPTASESKVRMVAPGTVDVSKVGTVFGVTVVTMPDWVETAVISTAAAALVGSHPPRTALAVSIVGLPPSWPKEAQCCPEPGSLCAYC